MVNTALPSRGFLHADRTARPPPATPERWERPAARTAPPTGTAESVEDDSGRASPAGPATAAGGGQKRQLLSSRAAGQAQPAPRGAPPGRSLPSEGIAPPIPTMPPVT